jgi:type VI secretion system protein ImpJ
MLQKPHWTLGLELGPHHMEFQDRYHEDLVAHRFERLSDYAWGIHEIEWAMGALAAGQLTIRRLDAVLPDGTPVACGTAESPSTPALTVRDLGPKNALIVYVGVPRVHANGPNVDEEGDGQAGRRYAKESRMVPDFASATDLVRLEWLRPNVRLLLEGDRLDDFVTIPCARVIRTAAGTLSVDDTFIGPITSIRASPFIQAELRHLVDALLARRTALKNAQATEAADAVRRWMLSLVGSFVPRVADLIDQPHATPLVAYRVLAEILGALSAFTREGDFRVPPFDYDNLGTVFCELFGNLSVMLDALSAQQHRRIPLQRIDENTLFAELKEPAIFRNDFFLGVAADDTEAVRRLVPLYFKIAAWSELSVVVRTATSGVPLQQDVRPPATLPQGPGVTYFRLEKNEAFTAIFKTGQLGIYQTTGIGVLDVALFAVEVGAK